MSQNQDQTRVLAIVGSPRRNGNTETLVDAVLAGAQEAGALTAKVSLRDLDLRPCLACDACQRTGACVQKDDMAALLDKMQEAQVWVLGTPVYWWGPTAQFKAFLDRWYGSDRKAVFPGKRVILTIPGDKDRRSGHLCRCATAHGGHSHRIPELCRCRGRGHDTYSRRAPSR